MSSLNSGSGQEIILSTNIESHDDNNADSDNTSSSCSSVCDDQESCEKKTKTCAPIYMKMMYIIKEIGLMLIVCVAYAALTHDPPKITKSPAAYPFFPKGAIVTDWYRGQISAAIDKARESDIAFVMFYAPWDAESQETRFEFELTARYMQKLVSFAAVNCWQPGSECRNQYNKVYSWPVLIAYPAHGRGIQYNGPKSAPYMMKFLNNIMKPIIRINNLRDLYELEATYDAVIVAKVDSRPGSSHFAAVYSTALRFLEKDPFKDVAFAIFSKSTEEEPSFELNMWNESLFYPEDKAWKSDLLLNFVVKNLHQVTMWIAPTGTKSQQLSNYVQSGPAMIIFTPNNPLAQSVDYYKLLREIGYEYFNCKNDPNLKQKSIFTRLYRSVHHHKYTELLSTCVLNTNSIKENVTKNATVITYSPSVFWVNSTCCLSRKLNEKSTCGSCDDLGKRLPQHCVTNSDDCFKLHPENVQDIIHEETNCDNSYHIEKYRTSMIKDIPQTKKRLILLRIAKLHAAAIGVMTHTPRRVCNETTDSNIVKSVHDNKNVKNLRYIWEQTECRLGLIAEKFQPLLFSKQDSDSFNLTGLSCKTNKTLSLLAMDSLQYHHFAERFGIDILKKKDKTAVIIINDKMETFHIFDGHITDRKLREFIQNFTQNNLRRALHSSSSYKYTHVYPTRKYCDAKEFCVTELDTNSFEPTVMKNNKVVIVLYHSKQCSFCNGISYTFLMASKALSHVKSIEFARIDGDLNTLPWEYTMETYPTILFFPAKRKSESRAYPQDTPLTVSNLISFVLSNIEPTLKLHVMWSICNQTKFKEEKNMCIKSLRAENLVVIEQTLKEWRSSDLRIKPKILYKLQQLKQLHLQLAGSPNNENFINDFFIKNENNKIITKMVKDEFNRFRDDL